MRIQSFVWLLLVGALLSVENAWGFGFSSSIMSLRPSHQGKLSFGRTIPLSPTQSTLFAQQKFQVEGYPRQHIFRLSLAKLWTRLTRYIFTILITVSFVILSRVGMQTAQASAVPKEPKISMRNPSSQKKASVKSTPGAQSKDGDKTKELIARTVAIATGAGTTCLLLQRQEFQNDNSKDVVDDDGNSTTLSRLEKEKEKVQSEILQLQHAETLIEEVIEETKTIQEIENTKDRIRKLELIDNGPPTGVLHSAETVRPGGKLNLKDKETDEQLKKRYAGIESLEERAYQILVDLGMAEGGSFE